MARNRITRREIDEKIRELYKKGYAPQEIMLLLRSSHKTDKEIENVVMKNLTPLFS